MRRRREYKPGGDFRTPRPYTRAPEYRRVRRFSKLELELSPPHDPFLARLEVGAGGIEVSRMEIVDLEAFGIVGHVRGYVEE